MRRLAGALLTAGLLLSPALVGRAEAGTIVTLLALDDFAGACGSVLVCAGHAAESGSALRLVPAEREQSGAAWLPVPVGLEGGAGFLSRFSFRLDGGGMVADGLAFVIARDPSGLGAPERYGGSMGFEEVGQSLAVEFDTYDNGEPGGDNHVALARDGVLGDIAWSHPYGTVGCDGRGAGCMANGAVWTALVAYDGAQQHISVALRDGDAPWQTVIDRHAIDLRDVVGGESAYLGFSAGTGDGFMNHDLLGWSLHGGHGIFAQFAATTVPEPAGGLLFGVALAGWGLARRR